jgi:hypothetical protein
MCLTKSTETLASEARALAREIETRLLAFASAEAREEWKAFRRRWSTDTFSEAPTPFPNLDEPFEVHVGRMRRFRAILEERRERGDVAAA